MADGVRLSRPPSLRVRGSVPWLGVALLLAVPALAGPLLPSAALEWQAALVLREPWRLWSAAWVHYGGAHLALNLAGTALVAALGVYGRLPPRAAAAWALAWPLTHAALLLRPGLAHYAGLSGVLHAGVAVAAIGLLRAPGWPERRLGAALLVGLVAKVASETPWDAVLPYSALLGIRVVPFAHAAGVAAGVLCALLMAGRRGARSTGPRIVPHEHD